MSSVNKGRRRVVFRIAAPGAVEVGVGGSFNDWNAGRHPLKKKPGGFWEKIVMLPPGRYEYKYMVDGRWCLDPSNSKVCDNIFGTGNSVIEISPMASNSGSRKP
jgi:1,4-alpha-glucan branching enzyme